MPSVCYTKPREEFRAKAHIEEQGFRVFLPLCKSPRNPDPKPLFPRYLFVWVPENRPWRPIVNTPGVSDILRCSNEGMGGEKLALVPDHVIAQIQTRMDDDGGAILVGDADPVRRKFKEGEKLRIVGGVNIGLEGIYVSSSKDRVVALLNMFGRPVTAVLPERFVA